MEQVFEFAGNHLLLVGTFVVLLVLFVRNEMRRGGSTVSPQQLIDLVNRDNAVVIDLRDRTEYEQGHVVGSINVPFSTVGDRLAELERYRERPVVLACRMGQHSGMAGTQLRKAGFERVVRLAGGMIEWQNQNLPLVRGKK